MKKLLLLFALCLLPLDAAAQSNRTPAMSSDDPQPSRYDPSGHVGVLYRKDNLMTPVAGNVNLYRLYAKYAKAQDKDNVQYLIDSDDLLPVKPNTPVRLLGQEQATIEGKFLTLIHVRILSGPAAGREGWTNRDFFSPADDDSARDEVIGKNKDLRLGGKVTITSPYSSSGLYLFVNEEAFKNASAEGQRRQGLISQMLATGAVFQVPEGTKAVISGLENILMNGRWYAVAVVRIDEGRFAGKAGYVFQAEVKSID